MSKRLVVPTLAAVALLMVSGCSGITNPARLAEFDWNEVPNPDDVTEGIDTAVGLGDLFVLGQMFTPTKCYRLEADFDENGSRLTLRVNARVSNPNCGDGIGGYRYTATIRNLEFGNYDLRVVHDISGAENKEYTESIEIR